MNIWNYETQEAEDGSNKVPDAFEADRLSASRITERKRFQFIAFDIEASEANGHAFFEETSDTVILAREKRWLHFELLNRQGGIDIPRADSLRGAGSYYFRSNFWATKVDPDDPENSFYISHRGGRDNIYGNNVIRVTVTGDSDAVRKQANTGCTEITTVSESCVKDVGDYMSFERVYGFADQYNKYHYITDFDIQKVGGDKILLVNHFREQSNFSIAESQFSVEASVIGDDSWLSYFRNTAYQRSWFGVALGSDGTAMSCSFYGNAVMKLDVQPRKALDEKNVIY